MKASFILFLFANSLLCSCGQNDNKGAGENNAPAKRNNSITKISFALEGCFGHCPMGNIEIDSSLGYKYYGGMYSTKSGYYTGKISPGAWDSINMKFEAGNFRQLDSAYLQTDDDREFDLVIYYEGKRKHVRAEYSDLPKNIQPAFDWLAESCDKIKLAKSADSLHFENPILDTKPLPPIIFTEPK